jgi:tRNA-specific 2-thiouridylase
MIAARERVVVAMSGGVDSTVAAALLVERGCEVIGVTLRLLQGEETAGDAVHEARAAADRLGIAHHVLDGRREFEELVLRRSWDEYARGRTPNPCVVCNARIKFGLLLDHARSLGATKIATGHYARLDATPTIRRGVDRRKDQSYFLWALDARQLAAVLFPLGELTKQQVRDRARSLGLPNAERAESQDACFVRDDQQFAEELRRHFGEPARSGVIVDEAGKVLGAHQGIHHFTIGQRRGLGVALGRPAWVAAIDAPDARVVLADDEHALLAHGLEAGGVVWHATPSNEPTTCEVQIRYRHPPAAAVVEHTGGATVRVRFAQPVKAVTPGQAVVFYDGDRVLGGGWIERALEVGE